MANKVVIPLCKEAVERDFREELVALLVKYEAELEAEDHYPGYSECGQDVRMTVYVPAKYDEEGDLIREYCVIDLGTKVDWKDKVV